MIILAFSCGQVGGGEVYTGVYRDYGRFAALGNLTDPVHLWGIFRHETRNAAQESHNDCS